MDFVSLTQIYYSAPDRYEEEYKQRFFSPFTQHISILIHQYNRRTSYPAFFNYTGSIALLIEKVYKEYENFLYVVHSVPPVVLHQFTLLSILDEVKSTNDIEGVHSTRKELREILDGMAPHAERFTSIVNKYHDLITNRDIPFRSCEDIRRFFDEFAHEEIIKENPNHKLDGRIFRKSPVSIESSTGKVIHQGVHPEDNILSAMEQALAVLHDNSIPFLIRLGLFHYFFAYIHPFYDGNGRTDRFITSYYLKRNFHTLLALRLSVFIKKNRKKYYDLFSEADSEINRGDMTPFIIGFMNIILGTIADTIALLQRKKEQLEKYEERISALPIGDKLSKRMYFILLQAALFYGQGISITELSKLLDKSRGTVQKRLDETPRDFLTITKVNKTLFYKMNLSVFR